MAEDKVYTAMGLMSGTSLDGIDLALVKTDGKDFTELLDFRMFPYEENVRTAVKGVFGSRYADEKTAEAERLLTDAHIQAIKDFGHEAELIGYHGQTILHDPWQKFTWQIGDCARVAKETGINVVGQMRQADVIAGGQGAPLLPLCHRAFAANVEKPIAILNLGGVGNITWLGKERTDILAFDTGPANALIDDVVKERTDQDFDVDGAMAEKGKVNKKILKKWLAHEYFERPVPKSLDRDEWEIDDVKKMKTEDAVATLTAFTVQSIVQSFSHLPDTPKALYVAGGGRHNKKIMHDLAEYFSFEVLSVEALGWNGDGLEAQGFAYLAVRSQLGLALTLPTTTGVPEPMTGGVLFKASADNEEQTNQ